MDLITFIESVLTEDFLYRPSTSNPFRSPYKINDPIGVSHYTQTFFEKNYSKPQLIRSGSATGTRNNQPQPSKEFMAWKYKPLIPVTNPNSSWSKELTQDMVNKAIQAQMKTVYTNDYADIMQRVQSAHEEANKTLKATMRQIPETKKLNTESRLQFQRPIQPALLRNNTTRFGCRT